MTKIEIVMVRRDEDVIIARSRVRDLARGIGMTTVEQARISLATSAAARSLGIGAEHHGQITFEGMNGSERVGIRVICQTKEPWAGEPTTGMFTDAKAMADELSVQKLESQELTVTVIKWATNRSVL